MANHASDGEPSTGSSRGHCGILWRSRPAAPLWTAGPSPRLRRDSRHCSGRGSSPAPWLRATSII